MKRIQVLLCSLLFAFSVNAQMETNGIIKINPLVFGHYQGFYEMPITENKSAILTAAYQISTENFSSSINGVGGTEEISTKDFSIYPEYRFYRFGVPFRMYWSVFGRYRTSNETVTSISNNGIDYSHTRNRQNIGAGLMIGKQIPLFRRMTFDWYAGLWTGYQFVPSITFNDANVVVSDYETDILTGRSLNRMRFGLRLGFNVGFILFKGNDDLAMQNHYPENRLY